MISAPFFHSHYLQSIIFFFNLFVELYAETEKSPARLFAHFHINDFNGCFNGFYG